MYYAHIQEPACCMCNSTSIVPLVFNSIYDDSGSHGSKISSLRFRSTYVKGTPNATNCRLNKIQDERYLVTSRAAKSVNVRENANVSNKKYDTTAWDYKIT